MNNIKYKATEGTLSYIFNTELECDTFITSNPTYIKGTYEVDINEHYAQVFQRDLSFGKTLINTFLIDNRLSPVAITPTQSLTLLQKFQVVSALCDKGDIKSVSVIFPSIEVDAIYTQERKDKYIQMITNHLLYL